MGNLRAWGSALSLPQLTCGSGGRVHFVWELGNTETLLFQVLCLMGTRPVFWSAATLNNLAVLYGKRASHKEAEPLLAGTGDEKGAVPFACSSCCSDLTPISLLIYPFPFTF